MAKYPTTPKNLLALPSIPPRKQQGLEDGVRAALYGAGSTSGRDFFQPMGVTAYKFGLSSRLYIQERIADLRRRNYAGVVADLRNREVTISKHPKAHEWFLSPLSDPSLDTAALALLKLLPHGEFDNGIVTFRLPPAVDLTLLEQEFQKKLLQRNVNTFLSSADGRQRLIACGHTERTRLFTDYADIGRVRRSVASELFLVRPLREMSTLLAALLVALEELQAA